MSAATNGVIVDSSHFMICQNTGAFSFHLDPTELDTAYHIYVSSRGVPAGASFVVTNDSTNHPTCLFSWTSATTPGTYTFFVTFQDNACSIAGINTVAYTVTINPQATITGTLTACVGSTTTLTGASSGGTWTSGATGIATVGSSSGIVTGVSAGTAPITYS